MSKYAVLASEELLPRFGIQGGATATMHEENAKFDSDYWGQNLSIDTQLNSDQGFHFHVAWRQIGQLGNHLDKDMQWRVEVLMEQIGKGEFQLPASLRIHEEQYVQGNPVNYTATFRIPPRTVPKGVYRVVVSLTLRDPNPPKGTDQWMPVAAFGDLGFIQIYED